MIQAATSGGDVCTIDEVGGVYFITQPPYSNLIDGPTYEEENRRRRAWRQALAEASEMGLEPADPEIYPEQEGIDGTTRWLLLPAKRGDTN